MHLALRPDEVWLHAMPLFHAASTSMMRYPYRRMANSDTAGVDEEATKKTR
jgi:hypothetical protein